MKYLIAFLAGATVGALGVYLYLNNKIENKIDEKVNEEMTNFFKRQESLKERLSKDDHKAEYESTMNEYKKQVTEYTDTPETSSIVEVKGDFTSYREDSEEDDEEDYITDEEMSTLLNESRQRMSEGPRIISEDNTDCMAYDTVELTYYPEDNMLLDVYGHEVEYPDAYFGSIDWRQEIMDQEKIIIRNPEEATDYIVYNDDLFNKGE